jgi:hypothetical protein
MPKLLEFYHLQKFIVRANDSDIILAGMTLLKYIHLLSTNDQSRSAYVLGALAAKTYGTPNIASRDALCTPRLLLLETADYSILVKHYNRSDPTAGWVPSRRTK